MSCAGADGSRLDVRDRTPIWLGNNLVNAEAHLRTLSGSGQSAATINSSVRRTDTYRCSFHLHIRAPVSLCAAICSFVCRVSTSFRDGLIGCAQSQSFRASCSVAHPAVETAIKSSIAIGLNIMSNLRRCGDGFGFRSLTLGLPGGLAGSPALEPGNPQGCKHGADDETASGRSVRGSRPASCPLLHEPLAPPDPDGHGRRNDDQCCNECRPVRGTRRSPA